jgi:hypothetical protein
MVRRTTVIALLVWVGFAGRPFAGQKDKDPQSAVEPRSQPGAGQKFLEKFVGEWDVVKLFFAPSGAALRTEGTCRQSMIHGGRFLQSDFTFGQGAKQSTGTGLIGFEPQTGRFTSVWVDSRQTKMSMRQSKDAFDGKEIVLHAKALGGDGKERQSRTVTRLEGDGRRIVHRQYNATADGKERLLMELVLTRTTRPALTPR